MRPRLLDLFCGAGGAGMGYHRAGFDVTGVDIKPQPRYPFPFVLGDALEYVAAHGQEYDVIHASPPCQAYTDLSKQRLAMARAADYPDLIHATRSALLSTGRPFVIENVDGAPLINPAMLCGSWFGLDLWRHRGFEATVLLLSTPCSHQWQAPRFRSLDKRQKVLARVVGVHGHINYAGESELRRLAMGIDWMTNDELSEAIPPAYTEFIGRQLLAALEVSICPDGTGT